MIRDAIASKTRSGTRSVPALQPWARYPSVYEINTWVWLRDLATTAGRPVDLGSVPPDEWDALGDMGFDAVWFMGVWERSPDGIAIANRNEHLLDDFRRALPDFQTGDNVGSPYCVRRYAVDPNLGGPAALATARRELARRGMRLLLDFVPNHVAPDHPWAATHPHHFIPGSDDDLRNDPASYLRVGEFVYACGRDPYFPAWPDVLQLNAFDPGLRQEVRSTLNDIADQCDGVRCDMAMLVMNGVFERTWGARAGSPPATEYWSDVIPAVKQDHPEFLFIAEAYWGLEWHLQQLGFDFCYDKTLYDRLQHDDARSIRLHLCADAAYQDGLLRFVENHDEPRAASAFPPEKVRAAVVTSSTLPGVRLFHEGQFEGRRVRLPVFLARRPDEPMDAGLRDFYAKLLAAIDRPAFRHGQWKLCEGSGWPDNSSHENLVAWRWVNGDERLLIVVNLSDRASQGRIHFDWDGLADHTWWLRDALTGATYDRSGDEMAASGLYVDLAPWGSHLFECGKRES